MALASPLNDSMPVDATTKVDAGNDELKVLIQELADPSYAKRVNARTSLLNVGVGALEELYNASFSQDPQVASAARFLLKSNLFTWESELDTRRVKELLGSYAGAAPLFKQGIVEELARLEGLEGLPALCRIARYEPVDSIAKLAAFRILKLPIPVGQNKQKIAALVSPLVAGGGNASCVWLQKYFESEALEGMWWLEQVSSELKRINHDASKTFATVQFGQDFSKWVLGLLAKDPRMKDSAAQMGKLVLSGLKQAASQHMGQQLRFAELENTFSEWALDAGLPELVEHQYTSADLNLLVSHPLLAYYFAESLDVRGDTERAEFYAEKASKRLYYRADGKPYFPEPALDNQGKLPGALKENQPEMSDVERFGATTLAISLRKRGRFQWALRELELVCEGPLTSISTLRALYEKASLHHSLEDIQTAKRTLEPFTHTYANQPMFAEQMGLSKDIVRSIISAYYQYSGDLAAREGKVADAATHYRRSYDESNDNVDALIGLFALKLSESERVRERKIRMDKVNSLTDYVAQLDKFLSERTQQIFQTDRSELAIQLNSLAWLIANTEGDTAMAVLYARRATRLAPQSPEFSDTLAHAYFADGKVRQAVDLQRQAVEMMPHVPEFRRALVKFEAKLSTSTSN